MNKLLLVVGFLALIAVGYSNPKCRYLAVSNGTDTPCAMIDANISLSYHFINNEEKNVSMMSELPCYNGNISITDCSKSINLMFPLGDYALNFVFNETSDNKWNMGRVAVVIVPNNDTFPDSDIEQNVEGVITSAGFDNIDSQMSYMCNTNRSFFMNSNTINVTMFVSFSELRVQAFSFKDDNSDFGDARRCNNDVSGSKIVPIAVGAALAGLVIIVLIAYIIGRLRSRRQSSYEALS